MKKIFFVLFCLFSTVAWSQINSPKQIENLSAWWCADSVKQDSGSKLSIWENLIDSKNSVFQMVDENSPTLITNVVGFNNHSVVRFDGNDYLDGENILNATLGQTAFVVAVSNNPAGALFSKAIYNGDASRYAMYYSGSYIKGQVQVGKGNSLLMLVGKNKYGQCNLFSHTIDVDSWKYTLYQDNIGVVRDNIKISTSKCSNSFNFLIGAYNNNSGTVPPNSSLFLNGDIAELIFYNRSLSNIERQSVENYLRSKYFPGTEREQFSLGNDTVVSYGFKPITLTVPDRTYIQTIEWNTGETTQSIQVQKTGVYSVLVSDDWGYEYVDTIAIDFPEIKQIYNQTICLGDTLVWDCGLSGYYSYAWNTGETTQSLAITKAGTYSVTVTDNAGYSITSKEVTIAIDSFPKQVSLGVDTTLCKGNVLQLQKGTELVKSYEWFTGDETPYCAIDNSGEYSVMVVDSNNCVARDTIEVTVHGVAPIVNFIAENVCDGNTTQILQNSYTTDNTEIVEHTWIIANDTLVGDVVNLQFPSWGEYLIQVRAQNEEGCVGVRFDTIQIYPVPIASFSPLIACQYTEREINSTSKIASGTIDSYSWMVNGTSSTGSSVQVMSDEVKTIPMQLTVTSDHGCTATTQADVQVVSSTKINLVHNDVCVGDTIMIFDATDYPVYNAKQDAYWLIDNTQKRNYSSFMSYKATDTTTHVLALYAKTFNGCWNIGRDTLRPYAIPAPQVDTVYTCIGEETVLRNMGNSRDNLASYVWNIGDSLQYSEEKPTIVMRKSGKYPMSLLVTTEHGCTSSTTSAVIVDEQPQAEFSFFPKKGAEPLLVTFTNESKNACSYQWVFEKNETETSDSPSYLFTDKETSYAKLIANSVHGCKDSVVKRIPLTLADEQLQITDVQTTIDANGFVSYSVQILNSGNVSVSNIELLLSSPDIASLAESWTGTLEAGKVLDYMFVAKTKSINGALPQYVCVTAEITSPEEYKVYFSDSYCVDKTDEFSIYYIAPNPVGKEAKVAFNTKRKGTIMVSCIDEAGKVRLQQEWSDVEAGYHTIAIDTMELPSGRYVLMISQDNQKQQIPFVK